MCSYIVLRMLERPASTEIYTLSLHDALPISRRGAKHQERARRRADHGGRDRRARLGARDARQSLHRRAQPRPSVSDRKSTRLNSSHTVISYAVFCLKKKIDLLIAVTLPAPQF